MLYNIDIHYID